MPIDKVFAPPREKGCSTIPPPRGIVYTDPLLCLSHLHHRDINQQSSHVGMHSIEKKVLSKCFLNQLDTHPATMSPAMRLFLLL